MCMWDGGDDQPQVSRTSFRRTRKLRKCDECGRSVHPGEFYQNVFMVYDAIPSTFVMCEHCRVAAGWLVGNCGGYLLCAVAEDIHEHIVEYRGPKEYRQVVHGLRRMEVGLRRQWQRFDNAGLMALPKIPPVVEAH